MQAKPKDTQQTQKTHTPSIMTEVKSNAHNDTTSHVVNSSVAIRFLHALIDACIDIEVNEQTFELHEELIDTIVVLASTQVCFLL